MAELDWSTGELAEGLRCYRAQQFFAAHEHWESVWLEAGEPEKTFLQAIIQVAAAFHHFQRDNRLGTASLLNGARRKLDPLPALFAGVDVAELRSGIAVWLEAIERGGATEGLTFPQMLICRTSAENTGEGRRK